ncbi:sensor histidine kinase [Inquilinus limosus]|uniref:histidine kinase n=1 Tax=Inquilinus limosus TaxID=171674 RepID=A0A211ZGZ1_9PROT|nr:HAMP domain-containing sensor histidine kinase [Inquilinus limosus]OWJ64525.1 hypothetical protein BWR60_24100 [Inquilinus limosus]
MILGRLVRTATFRLAAGFAALFSVSIIVVSSITYMAMTQYSDQQIDLSISSEMKAVRDSVAADSAPEIVKAINDRITDIDPDYFYYALEDSDGGVLAGNLRPVPAVTGWADIPLDTTDGSGAAERHTIRGLGVDLTPELHLFIGRDTQDLDELQEGITRFFLAGAAATVLLALASGLVLSARFLRRVEAVNTAARHIMDGHLDERVPSRGKGADEFDRLADNLNAMLDRIQQLMQGLHQVSSDIAHDLRTPLSHMRQRLEAARLKAASADDYDAAVERAVADIDGILGVFAALLRIAQIESGARREGFAPVDLSGVFDTIIDTYGPVADDAGYRLAGTVTPGLRIRGDRQLLTQMLANLVENTIRHTPPGTAIQVSLAPGPDGPVGQVRDTGPGIPEAAREKVFQRFFRLDAARMTPGSGLGLSLVAAVAQLHEIRVALADNRPGLAVTLDFAEPARAIITAGRGSNARQTIGSAEHSRLSSPAARTY